MLLLKKVCFIGLFLSSLDLTIATNLFQCDTSVYYGGFSPSSFSDGALLKQAVHDLIDDHTVIPYTQVDEILFTLDGDGTNIRGIYSNIIFQTFPTSWNKEHVWPRSRGVFDSGPDTSDLFHIFPASSSLNSARGNKYYDDCQTFSDSTCESPASTPTIVAAPGTSESRDTWAPPANIKGDLARAIFYMAVRYDGSDVNTVALNIGECSSYATCGINTFGRLSTLIRWHNEDPVDDTELSRVDTICQSYQGNRNPFVDFPELVDMLSSSYVNTPSSVPIGEATLLPFILMCCFICFCACCSSKNNNYGTTQQTATGAGLAGVGGAAAGYAGSMFGNNNQATSPSNYQQPAFNHYDTGPSQTQYNSSPYSNNQPSQATGTTAQSANNSAFSLSSVLNQLNVPASLQTQINGLINSQGQTPSNMNNNQQPQTTTQNWFNQGNNTKPPTTTNVPSWNTNQQQQGNNTYSNAPYVVPTQQQNNNNANQYQAGSGKWNYQ